VHPPPPTDLTATAGNGQITLSWTSSLPADNNHSYKVKRAITSGGPYTVIAAIYSKDYTDTGLTNGTTYYYVVSAVAVHDHVGLESSDSNEASATPQLINNAAFVSQSVPASMVAGERYNVSVTMRNTGNTTWSAGGANPYRLGYQNANNPSDNMVWGIGRVEAPASVAPGAEATFNFTVTAPSTPGTYSFRWQMVHELVEWFGEYTPNVAVIVSAPPNTPPTVRITSPVNGATFTAPATITINADARDSDGSVAKVEFFQGNTKLGEDTTAPSTPGTTSPPAATA
jgi:hypothetical protein